MYESPLLFDVEPNKIELIRPDRPYSNYGDLMIKGSFGDGDTYGEDRIYFAGDPLADRIQDVEALISAICQTERPEDAARLKICEMDLILLNAQRVDISVDEHALEVVVEEGLRITEEGLHATYDAMSEEPGFVEWFSAAIEEKVSDDTSVKEVTQAVKVAFKELIQATYDDEEKHQLHILAIEASQELEARERFVAVAKELAPLLAVRPLEEPVEFEIAQQALIAA